MTPRDISLDPGRTAVISGERMRFKFNCPACGQRISAEPHQYHTKAPCPTCGEQLLVPMPTVPLRSESPALPALVKRLEAMGITYARPAQPMDEIEEMHRLQKVLHEFKHLDALLDRMDAAKEITRQAMPAEVMNIRNKLFAIIMCGDFRGANDEVKRLIFSVAPGLRPSA